MNKNQPQKILIVEDEKNLRHALEEVLMRAGFSVLLANDGEDGLSCALKNHPDLILLDIIMPKMNGVTMLKKLRQNAWGKTVPVLMLTNDVDPEHMRETLKDNATDYLLKSDWSIKEIVDKITTTLS